MAQSVERRIGSAEVTGSIPVGSFFAEIAQLVERFIRNEGVVGSSPIFSLRITIIWKCISLFNFVFLFLTKIY